MLEVDRTVKQLKSPNYPLPFSAGRECDWMLRAREGNQVSVVIKDLSLPGKNASGKCGRCGSFISFVSLFLFSKCYMGIEITCFSPQIF